MSNTLTKILLLAAILCGCEQGSSFSSGGEDKRNPVSLAPTPTPQSSPVVAATPTPTPTPNTPPHIPPNAVTQGSFSVWTVPARPAPLQDYQIFISIKLPSNLNNISYLDVTGTVFGTDGYARGIGALALGQMGDQFQLMGTSALMSLWVPGAENLVQDVIKVGVSKMNQSETITLIFGRN